jgi:aspartate racemase
VLVPGREDRGIFHRVIYDELYVGVVRTMPDASTAGSWATWPSAAPGRSPRLHGDRLLVGPDDAPVPVFDTTRLHADRAVEMALEPVRTR